MAIFAVLHVFAFPWKPYSIKHSYSDPVHQPGGGFSGGGTLKYQGGRFGLLALVDAFNIWDIIKGTARGFRWMFVGFRHRHDDISYKTTKADPAYTGPTFAGSTEPATELRPSGSDGIARADPSVEDDRAGLLRHSGQMSRLGPYSNDEYNAGDNSQVDLGRPQQWRQPAPRETVTPFDFDMKPSEFMDEDTSYGHGPGGSAAAGAGAGAGGLSGSSVHPAFRIDGGAPRGDADSIRPPTYRSRDPYG